MKELQHRDWLKLSPLLYAYLSSTPLPYASIASAHFFRFHSSDQSFKYQAFDLLITATTNSGNGTVSINRVDMPVMSNLEDDRMKCTVVKKCELQFQNKVNSSEEILAGPLESLENTYIAVSQQSKNDIRIYALDVLTDLKDKVYSVKPRLTINGDQEPLVLRSRRQELVSGTANGSVHVYNLNRGGQSIGSYHYHREPITDICWLSKNSKEKEEQRFLATVSSQPFIYIWDRRMKVPATKIEHRQHEVHCLAPMRNKSFFSGGGDSTIKYWDLRNVHCECYVFKEHTAPVTKIMQINEADKFMFMSGSKNGEVMIWEQEVEFMHGAHDSKIVDLGYQKESELFLSIEQNSPCINLWKPIPLFFKEK